MHSMTRVVCTAAVLMVPALATFDAQSLPALEGIHTIVQQNTGRFLDAHDTDVKDFRVVTRPPQQNATQRWLFTHLGGNAYHIEQQSSGRPLDAHDTAPKDFAVVTRPPQPNATQRWILKSVGNATFEIRQQSTGRNLDAHDTPDKDFGVVTRPAQNNSTQRWVIRAVGGAVPQARPGTCTIFGSVTGPVQAEACTDPACTQKVAATLRQLQLRTTSPDKEVAIGTMTGRDFVFLNVPPGQVYHVRPFTGWTFDHITQPVRCEANRSHRLYLRIKSFATES